MAKDHSERKSEANERGQKDAARGISPRSRGALDHPDIADTYMKGYKGVEQDRKKNEE